VPWIADFKENGWHLLEIEYHTERKQKSELCIALVRIAQKGNVIAKEEIIKLIRFTIYDWIERCPTLSSWEGYESLIQNRIEGCIRCYRYSGTFIGYLFKTLEYAGRGLGLGTTYSLDDSLYSQ
jgi:hypothetical protein